VVEPTLRAVLIPTKVRALRRWRVEVRREQKLPTVAERARHIEGSIALRCARVGRFTADGAEVISTAAAAAQVHILHLRDGGDRHAFPRRWWRWRTAPIFGWALGNKNRGLPLLESREHCERLTSLRAPHVVLLRTICGEIEEKEVPALVCVTRRC
jgi:hypothetical protein